eukprot:GDKI01044399.1.p1 GENE.GDKI01044399.1~~GDKI01044399.1.p1  ORF type:complete len:152 (-),score=47.83 GDKI01044399.1:114-569(-)
MGWFDWALGAHEFGRRLGHKKVTWRYRVDMPGADAWYAGVWVKLSASHGLLPPSTEALCNSAGFYGWSSDVNRVVDGTQQFEDHAWVFAAALSEPEVSLDLVTGRLTLTMCEGKVWQMEGLPVGGGEVYRAGVELHRYMAVRMVSCRVDFF